MKKTLSILLTVLLVFILMSISYTTNSKAETSTNLVANPSFEGKTWQVDANNVNFEDWDISRTSGNGIIKTWIETTNTHSGNKAFHWKTEAPEPTSISLSYYSNISKKIPIDESSYIEAGLWGYVISGGQETDVSLYFYSENGTNLGRFWGQEKFGDLSLSQWKMVSFLWYPSSLGSGDGYIPKGAKYARLNIYANWHSPGAKERIDDDAFVKQYNQYPNFFERMNWNLTDVKVSLDYSTYLGTSILSYSAHPSIKDEEFRTGGKDQLLWDIIKQFGFSKMRFQSGNPFCLSWNETANTCDESNIGFDNFVISKSPNNGLIKISIETANVHSGTKAFHHYAQAPSSTNLSFSYNTDLFPIDETKYYEGGFWSYPIQGGRDVDITLLFYDENKNFLARRWGKDSLGSFLKNSWNRTSVLWYPSSLGQGNGYVEKGTKYAKLQIFINWHVSGTKEAIDDDTFVREYNSLPTTNERASETATNLISNPSFESYYAGYDWKVFDQMIEAVKKVSEDVIISLPAGTWSNANYMPDGMPLNTSIYIVQWTYNKGYYPTLDAYCKFVKDIVKHTNIEKGYNVKYWEIGNEPPIDINEAITMGYIDLFNTAEKCMHEVDPTVLTGCDRSDFPDFMSNYFSKYANNVGFLSFHNYDIGCTCMFPCNQTNTNNIYYPPNDKNGWVKDERIMLNIQPREGTRFSPKEAKDFWKEKRGQDLEVINTEINMNSAWRNGSDSRMNNLLGAVWYAAKVKTYVLDGGVSVLNYFVISSGDTNSPTTKYGGFGFGMMNSSYPYNPYAPYWTNYLLTKYIPEGSLLYNSTSTEPDVIDTLAVDSGSSKNILLINKVNETVKFTLSVLGFTIKNSNLYLLDGTTYIQRYEPSLDKTMIYKSEISTIQLPKNNVQSFIFNGYTVAILEAFPDTSAPYLAGASPDLSLKSATWDQSQNRYYAKAECSGANEVKVHSDTKPSAVKVGGTIVNYDDSLSAFPSWRYDSTNKIIILKFSC